MTDTAYLVQQVLKYSDGTETVINYVPMSEEQNIPAAEETAPAEEVASEAAAPEVAETSADAGASEEKSE